MRSTGSGYMLPELFAGHGIKPSLPNTSSVLMSSPTLLSKAHWFSPATIFADSVHLCYSNNYNNIYKLLFHPKMAVNMANNKEKGQPYKTTQVKQIRKPQI